MINFMSSNFNIKKIELACLVKAGEGKPVHKHRQSHGLVIYLSGNATINFDGKKLVANNGTIVYFPKGSNYTITDINHVECYAINFQLDEDISFEPFVIKVENIQNYLPNFIKARNLCENRRTSYELKIKSELYDIIYKLHNEYAKSQANKNSSSIQNAIDYINTNYLTQNIPISKLAQLCKVSEVSVRNKFIKEFGVSPNKYIKNLKLQYAEELLLSGFYKINEICYICGFNDESYFNREFKKHFGKPPKEYLNTFY